MKKALLVAITTISFMFNASAQTGNWSVGGGLSHVIIRGDLVNLGAEKGKSSFDWGANIFVDKMFNRVFGMELNVQYFTMAGGPQNESRELFYSPYGGSEYISNVYFKGHSVGGSLAAVMNLTNLIAKADGSERKYSLNTYFGFGYHQYVSKLYRISDNALLYDFGSSKDNTSSTYFLTGLGLKRRLNDKIDVELRSTYNFNYEDHLDGAISLKQTHEHFITTMVGVIYKFKNKEGQPSIWGDEATEEDGFELVDTDDDGVIDDFDKDNRTPKGVKVYGDGTAVDTDKDGISDFEDDCPLVYGLRSKKGCPEFLDTDGDGVSDDKDACPDTAGLVEYGGCPKMEPKKQVEQRLNFLVKNVYFDTDKSDIKVESYPSLVELATVLNQNPELSFYVDGHTDSTGGVEFNQKLSEKRANEIKNFLENNLGVSKTQLEARGFGDTVPVAKNNDAQRRQLNRRVEIKIKG